MNTIFTFQLCILCIIVAVREQKEKMSNYEFYPKDFELGICIF